MPNSLTEQVRELKTQIAVLNETVRVLSERLQDAHIVEMVAKIAVLELQVAELKEREQENDRRRWQMNLLLFGSMLTLAIQIALLFVRK